MVARGVSASRGRLAAALELPTHRCRCLCRSAVGCEVEGGGQSIWHALQSGRRPPIAAEVGVGVEWCVVCVFAWCAGGLLPPFAIALPDRQAALWLVLLAELVAVW